MLEPSIVALGNYLLLAIEPYFMHLPSTNTTLHDSLISHYFANPIHYISPWVLVLKL